MSDLQALVSLGKVELVVDGRGLWALTWTRKDGADAGRRRAFVGTSLDGCVAMALRYATKEV